MSRRIRRLTLAVAVLSGCATWPNVHCTEESPQVGALLDAIERIVEIKKPRESAAILEALFVCRQNAHSGSAEGGALTQDKHCKYIVAAYRWAFKGEFAKCLNQLMHGSGMTPLSSPGEPFLDVWPDIPCAELTAREMLGFIQLRLDGPDGLPAGAPLRMKIEQAILRCLGHPASGTFLTLPQHCAKVTNAFVAATQAAPPWPYVSSELEHMP